LPLFREIIADTGQGGIELWLWRKAWLVEPFVPCNARDLILDALISKAVKEADEGVLELERVEGLAREFGKIMRDELVEVLAADETVQIIEEVEALLVRNCAERIIGVNALVTDAELCKFVVGPKPVHRVL
jgi:hypothetical protein